MLTNSQIKPAAFYIPVNYNQDTFPPSQQDYAHFFLNLIHWKQINRQTDEKGYVHLKKEYLTKFIPKDVWPSIKTKLVEAGVIFVDELFLIGKKCFGYKIADKYLKTHRVECKNSRLNKKIQDYNTKEELELLPIHRWLKGKFKCLAFDLERAKEIIETLIPDDINKQTEEGIRSYRTSRLEYCNKINNQDNWFKLDLFGRFHTPIVNTEKELRSCFLIDNQPMINVDLANSQPLIAGICARLFFGSNTKSKFRALGTVFNGKGHPYCYKTISQLEKENPNIPEDVKKYIEVCEQGKFYDSFLVEGLSREEVKLRFFKEVFFGRNKIGSEVKTTFTNTYPSIAEMLWNLKKKEYQRSSWILQNLESTLFIYNICGRIMREKPNITLFTIHDSILTPKVNAKYVDSVIRSEFARIGVKPTLRWE